MTSTFALRTFVLACLGAAPFAAMACRTAGTGDAGSTSSPSHLLAQWLAAEPERFGDVIRRADELRLKIELAVVTPDGDGVPTLERHSFDAGPEYFYPASSVKTCAAIAAALRLRETEATVSGGLPYGLLTPLRFHPLFEGESIEEEDATNLDGGTLNLGHAMRKVFLVSDNVAFNHLYEFAGNAYLNRAMGSAGLDSTRIFHRLSEFRSPEDQLRTPRIEILAAGASATSLPARVASPDESNDGMTGVMVGEHYYRGGSYFDAPMSFGRKNYMSLRDLQDMHIMLLRPDVRIPGRGPGQGFPLKTADREFIRAAMAGTPGASANPVYAREDYPDDYSKFLAPGVWKVLPRSGTTIRDKVGRAYGFSITNSEVVDERTGRSYFLAATLYTNPNATLNDDDYDYDLADQFMADLGETVTRRVLQD